ncbi:winged helix-turn-helix domain-containing protein [Asticcacaulis solisilvae]|uniref:winged helix-turn-helix domain-containing protein n=1 Tax=Asticcacaulis solisilvae TaxID=1217274 RepID=UPI003FD8AB6F
MRRFAGFELDEARAELRTPAGEVLRLRPKTLAMLGLFAANPGRVITKAELMDAVWPNVHVGDDSLFQCIREIRTALGDERRELIRVVSGKGYLFAAEVLEDGAAPVAAAEKPPVTPPSPPVAPWWRRPVGMTVLVLAAIGLAGAAAAALHGLGEPEKPTVAVLPLNPADTDPATVAAAKAATARLTDGLAEIANIRVVAAPASHPPKADYVVSADLFKGSGGWDIQARLTRRATHEVVWSAPVEAEAGGDPAAVQTRMAAAIGFPLAEKLNALLNSDAVAPASDTRAVIEQATAAITQTSRDRFAMAEGMLKTALGNDHDNVDLAVSLAGLQLRGVQMNWYAPAERDTAVANARGVLEHALRVRPASAPALSAYCRLLESTNDFAGGLVACAKALSYNPWDGASRTHIGMDQLQLGRFDDAVASFKQADADGTPEVSRWVWKLDLGMTYILMGRDAEALPWIDASIAITPGTGRSYIMQACALEGLGRTAEAHAAIAKALALRPGTTVANMGLPVKNESPAFLTAAKRIYRLAGEAGLPER